jgi:hypothetical protein
VSSSSESNAGGGVDGARGGRELIARGTARDCENQASSSDWTNPAGTSSLASRSVMGDISNLLSVASQAARRAPLGALLNLPVPMHVAVPAFKTPHFVTAADKSGNEP